MQQPTSPPLPVDIAAESVAGEEDPGASNDVAVAAVDNCPDCSGTGKAGSAICTSCRGTGQRTSDISGV